MLKTCEKIIDYFYHSCRVFIKTLGKVLYNLVFKIDFNFKSIVTDLIKYDNKEMYDYVHRLEKNEFLKKNKIMRKMHDKVHFYEKLELSKYQKAYQKISTSLKNIENLGQRGELSYLNENSMYMNPLNMSRNRSVLTRGNYSMNESINQDMSQINFLDGLDSQMNTSVVHRPQNLLDIAQMFTEKMRNSKFTDMTFMTVELLVKKVKEFVKLFEEGVVTLNVDPKNRNEHVKLKTSRGEQNYEFYSFCFNEMNEKIDFCDNRFKIIELLIKNRGIDIPERESEKMYAIVTQNKDLMEEDAVHSQVDLDQIELLKLLEDSLISKKGIFHDKRTFMGHIEKIVNDTKLSLDSVFATLNRYEDKYMLSIARHRENKKKIEISKLQTREIKMENNQMALETRELRRELDALGKQRKVLQEEQTQIRGENQRFNAEKLELEGTTKCSEAEILSLQQEIVENEMYVIELEETMGCMSEMLVDRRGERDRVVLATQQKEKEFEVELIKVRFTINSIYEALTNKCGISIQTSIFYYDYKEN